MAIAADTLLEEARCLGCNSEASEASLLKLGLWQRMVTGVDEAVASFVARSGITSVAQIAAVTALVANAMAHGWWSKCDLIYPFVGGTAGAHAQNLKSSNFTITWNGTVTHDANGITGDGATGYGATGYIPASSGQTLLNSTHVGLYRRTTGGSSGTYAGVDDGISVIRFTRGFAAATVLSIVNALSGANYTLTSLAFSMGVRSSLTEAKFFTGGVDKGGDATVPTALPGISLFVLAYNNSGAPAFFSNANLAGLTAGSGITFATYQNMAADWQAFNTALGRQV